MIRVGINGYGTIGRRVADAVIKQEDMKLIGVTKTRPDYKARQALVKGIAIYLPNDKYSPDFQKAKVDFAGSLDDLLREVDIVVDATPELGAEYKPKYEAEGRKAIFQGGEDHDLTGLSFVAQCNYDSAVGKKMVRVVSCNTTALCRTMHALDTNFGVKKARVVLARRAADPDEVGKGPIDAVVPDPITVPSHHGPDVQSVMASLNITTMAIKIPTTHMHLHSIMTTLQSRPTAEQVVEALAREPRIMFVDAKSGFKSTASIIDLAREMNRPRNDIYEAVVWRDSVNVQDDEVCFFLAVHQEAIVTPENIDAFRALSGGYTKDESMRRTNLSLGIAPVG